MSETNGSWNEAAEASAKREAFDKRAVVVIAGVERTLDDHEFTHDVVVDEPIDEDRIRELFDEASDLTDEAEVALQAAKDEFKAAKEGIKEKLAVARSKRKLARGRTEPVSVECAVLREGTQEVTVRIDNGAEVSRRALTAAELQANLFADTEPPPADESGTEVTGSAEAEGRVRRRKKKDANGAADVPAAE